MSGLYSMAIRGMAVRHRPRWRRFKDPISNTGSVATETRSLPPAEEHADVARHSVGKVEDLGGKMKPMRLHIALPSEIDLGGLTPQRRRPTRLGDIDGAAPVAAHLTWEAPQRQ